ncbi:MAG: hypothetical protein ACP5CD_04090 [Thermovirgaceae bacterium]
MVNSKGLITSRRPSDLPLFMKEVLNSLLP